MKPSFFLAHPLEPNLYIERYGIDFEDFEVGQVFEHRPGRSITEAECLRHAARSLDLSPHLADLEYAHQLEGRLRVPETHVLATAATLSTKTFGKVVANLGWTNIQLEAVYAGDTLYAESEILGKRESASRPTQGIMHVRTRAHNQHRQWVLSYERQFLVYRRGMGPYEEAGY